VSIRQRLYLKVATADIVGEIGKRRLLVTRIDLAGATPAPQQTAQFDHAQATDQRTRTPSEKIIEITGASLIQVPFGERTRIEIRLSRGHPDLLG
jgi:hypothetical protein